jgi:exosortase H (IPTLxxWG-CTERM-specific)
MLKFLFLFCVLALIGIAALEWEMLLPAINFFCLILAKVAGVFIHLFDNSLIITGPVLRHGHHGFALEVAKECSGLSASWLLIVAIVAFESPWKHKLWGIVIGLLTLQTINLIRLISLYYIGDWMLDYFELFHEQIWPILLNISMILIFGGWLFYTMTHSTKS